MQMLDGKSAAIWEKDWCFNTVLNSESAKTLNTTASTAASAQMPYWYVIAWDNVMFS